MLSCKELKKGGREGVFESLTTQMINVSSIVAQIKSETRQHPYTASERESLHSDTHFEMIETGFGTCGF